MQSSEKITGTIDLTHVVLRQLPHDPSGFILFSASGQGAGGGKNTQCSSPVHEALPPGPSHLATVSHSCNSE